MPIQLSTRETTPTAFTAAAGLSHRPTSSPASDDTLAVLDLLIALEDCRDLKHACATLAELLKKQLACERVYVGMQRPSRPGCRLEAISAVERFDRQSQVARHCEAAMDEAVLRGDATVVTNEDSDPQPATRATLQYLRESGLDSVVTCPIFDSRQRTIGALMLVGVNKPNDAQRASLQLQSIGRRIGACLALFQRTDAGPVARTIRRGRNKLRTRAGVFLLIAIALVIGAMAVPVPYKIGCDSQLQPVKRRFVAAPFDGKLERVHVTAGEVIQRGDLLASMDGREFRLELAGLEAEQDRARKQRDSALAKQNTAAAQQAKLEIDRLELKRELLNERVNNLAIRSAIDGMVVKAELENAEGAPLSVGQMLFEIAPLAEMIVEVAIPEDEISYVAEDMEVNVRLDAYPRQTWVARIAKIHPRTEIRDSESVFIAEVMLDNEGEILRPGMNGSAKIVGPRRALGWTLFHEPWESFTAAMGW